MRRSHAPALYGILSDARLYRFIPKDPPQTLDALAARYERLETRKSSNGEEVWLNWAVCLTAESVYVGRVEATVLPDRSALIAYEIGVTYWGRGFATEACRRVIQALFDDYGVQRIAAEIDTRNRASIRLVERLGFQAGEVRIGADFFKGSASDEVTYTLLRHAGARATPGG